jgi:hypothetical protein
MKREGQPFSFPAQIALVCLSVLSWIVAVYGLFQTPPPSLTERFGPVWARLAPVGLAVALAACLWHLSRRGEE